MNKNFERIKKCINASSALPADKQSMLNAFANVADENLVDIAKLFEKEEKWVLMFNENRKMKVKAATTNDPVLWQEILDKEKKYLDDLTFGLD